MVRVAWLGRAGPLFESRRCDTPKAHRWPIHGPLGGILSRKARQLVIYVSAPQDAARFAAKSTRCSASFISNASARQTKESTRDYPSPSKT